MKEFRWLLVFVVWTASLHAQPLAEFSSVSFQYATAEEGAALLRTKDSFLASLSPFDLAARSKSRSMTGEAFPDFLGKQSLNWSPQERERMDAVLDILRRKVALSQFTLPPTISFVKTTGREEAGAAYCRGTNIVCLPQGELSKSVEELCTLVAHEVFHLWSRNSPDRRRVLYQQIGFREIQPLVLSESLAKLRITNPDAHGQNTVFDARLKNGTAAVMPVLLASRPYDFARGGEFFEYLRLVFFSVKIDSGGVPKLEAVNGRLVSYEIDEIQNFWDAVGRNTEYIIDPEEILADNFALLVLGGRITSPGVLDGLRTVLK